MNGRRRNDDGYTVAEISVVLILLSIASALMFGFLNAATETTTRTTNNNQAEADSQVLMRTLSSDIRSAHTIETTYPTTGTCTAGGSFTTSPYEAFKSCLRFTILRPNSGGATCPKTEVTYGLVSGSLLMDRVEYALSGSTCTATTTTTKKVVMEKIVNTASTPLFTYYNKNGHDLLAGSPSGPPTSASSIKVTLRRTYHGRSSSVLTFSNVVALRNKR